ncbi:hypothetical protein [Pseudomonas typographi]|uniref:Uncharacterized protein n=1 Tax=Pseudomonas typographi TaxID=2715964 RepID=A0ABR7Z0D1_9PSED|nr:hypothetical protein [Pseudomonas typographi]MBD1551443.1 hypothetical protein [Pseudomonas typographi]MBD1586497.1 hypothetical protein [Pseudomonas typographi]MBD1598791.1 hypothetical protein [Pseudomonas typographi]
MAATSWYAISTLNPSTGRDVAVLIYGREFRLVDVIHYIPKRGGRKLVLDLPRRKAKVFESSTAW